MKKQKINNLLFKEMEVKLRGCYSSLPSGKYSFSEILELAGIARGTASDHQLKSILTRVWKQIAGEDAIELAMEYLPHSTKQKRYNLYCKEEDTNNDSPRETSATE